MEGGRSDIYSSVLKYSIQLTLDHHKQLFAEDAVDSLKLILTFSDRALKLFSRLPTRKYPWLRVDSVSGYLPLESDLEDALNELADAKVLQILQNDSDLLFEEVWPACSSLSIDELKMLSTLITNGPTKGGSGYVALNFFFLQYFTW